jgi:hypothetical protein
VAQNHHARAIFFSFILSPVLCFPTFFVFDVKQMGKDSDQYYVDANAESELYR